MLSFYIKVFKIFSFYHRQVGRILSPASSKSWPFNECSSSFSLRQEFAKILESWVGPGHCVTTSSKFKSVSHTAWILIEKAIRVFFWNFYLFRFQDFEFLCVCILWDRFSLVFSIYWDISAWLVEDFKGKNIVIV